MKISAKKNDKSTTSKFEKFILPNSKKKNLKGGNDPIGIEDFIIT